MSGSQVASFSLKFDDNMKLNKIVLQAICSKCHLPPHCAGVEGDSVTQSSDGTDQESDQYEQEQAGWGEEVQESSGESKTGERECDDTGEVSGETTGEDSTEEDENVYGEDSKDEGQEGSRAEEWDSTKEGQDMEGNGAKGYLGDSFASSGMGDISGDGLEEGELPQDSSREMDSKGIHILTLGNIAGVKLDKID